MLVLTATRRAARTMPRTTKQRPGRIENRLDALMAERHMTVSGLARTARLSRLTVGQYRAGKVKAFRADTLAKLCVALGVDDLGALLVFHDK